MLKIKKLIIIIKRITKIKKNNIDDENNCLNLIFNNNNVDTKKLFGCYS